MISDVTITQPRITETPVTDVQSVDVEIVVPVYNEEAGLERSIRRLHQYLTGHFPLTWTVTIADNASRDRTWDIACRLSTELPGVQATHLDLKGRGRALRAAWGTSNAVVVAYMDVDLSTDLNALLPLVAPLLSGHSDVAIGSRLAPGARVARGPRRELISRAYNLILRAILGNQFSDAQCGFKAVRTDVAGRLLPLVEDSEWFFDTELLVLAERDGLRIHEVPVDWTDDPDSRVDVASTALADLKGIWRIWRTPPPLGAPSSGFRVGLTGQLLRFASIGAVSTVVFALLFLSLAGSLGPIVAAIVALGACSIANLSANRRLTFTGHRQQPRRALHRLLTVAAPPVVINVAALILLGRAGVTSAVVDLGVLTGVNLALAAVRFGLLRTWVFSRERTA